MLDDQLRRLDAFLEGWQIHNLEWQERPGRNTVGMMMQDAQPDDASDEIDQRDQADQVVGEAIPRQREDLPAAGLRCFHHGRYFLGASRSESNWVISGRLIFK